MGIYQFQSYFVGSVSYKDNLYNLMGRSKKRIQSYLIDKEKVVGKGAFGEVCLCEHQVTKCVYAAKIIFKAKVHPDQYMKNALQQQIQIHNGLKHKNIVSFLDVLETNNNIYIIQQYCENGTLRQLLNNMKKLSQADALHCLKCICLGFTEISRKGVIHRDLKPQNILIKQNQLKIADFGFAKKMINNRQLTATALGTPLYMAPQLLKGQKYSSKCDVWSIGVIYYQLLYGTHPWKGNNISQLISNIEKEGLYFDPQVPISEQSHVFLVQVLRPYQNQRLSWLQVFEHKIWRHLSTQQNQFKDISIEWRASYVRAAEKLNFLAQKVQIQWLIGAFLELEVPVLNFEQFKKVILWLQNLQQQEDMGIMYELFDKDCNGVIDFQQFVSSFGFNDGYKESIQIIHKLLGKGHHYQQIKTHSSFIQVAKLLGFQGKHVQNAFMLLAGIQL